MRNRQTNEGATGPVRNAAPSIRKRTDSPISGLGERSYRWTARLGAVVGTIAGLLWDPATAAAATLVARLRDGAGPATERAERLIVRSARRLQSWTAPLKDLAERARPMAAAVARLARRLVAHVLDRFGTRVTVMGAATAVFIGSTGSAAIAITNLDAPPSGAVAAAEAAPSEESAAAAAAAEDAAREAAEPEPVGGLSELQMANAVAIIEAGEDAGLDRRAWAIALATAMQESKFKNYANVNVAESYRYEYQAEGADHDSVGLFQQRPSSGWGSVEELMDPKTSASKFYDSLESVDGWEDMPVTRAAQAVQVSAFPDAYAQWEDLAWDIIAAYDAG